MFLRSKSAYDFIAELNAKKVSTVRGVEYCMCNETVVLSGMATQEKKVCRSPGCEVYELFVGSQAQWMMLFHIETTLNF